jgi:hypothetical protein
LGDFFQKVARLPVSRPQAHSPTGEVRRFLCELSFAPFVSKESGVTVYALQNRCKPTEIKTPNPLVRFFFLPL